MRSRRLSAGGAPPGSRTPVARRFVNAGGRIGGRAADGGAAGAFHRPLRKRRATILPRRRAAASSCAWPEAAGRRGSRTHGSYRRPRLLWPDEGGVARRLAPGPRGAVRADGARAVRVGPAALRGCARAAAAAGAASRPGGAAGPAAPDSQRDGGGGRCDAWRLPGACGIDLDAAPHRHGRLPRHGPADRAACRGLRRAAQAAAPAPAAGTACTGHEMH